MFRKILVPVDFNDLTRRTLDLAVGLVRSGGGRVVLFTVVDDSFPNPDILSFQLPWADYHRHLRDEAVRRLEGLRHEAGAEREAEVCVVRGNPARMIARFAQEEGCDLVVMATHGASGLHHALVGSVTRKVLHLATVPVLVVRLTAASDAGASAERA
jgi:nucleotide-binding universal stress UspA family protein